MFNFIGADGLKAYRQESRSIVYDEYRERLERYARRFVERELETSWSLQPSWRQRRDFLRDCSDIMNGALRPDDLKQLGLARDFEQHWHERAHGDQADARRIALESANEAYMDTNAQNGDVTDLARNDQAGTAAYHDIMGRFDRDPRTALERLGDRFGIQRLRSEEVAPRFNSSENERTFLELEFPTVMEWFDALEGPDPIRACIKIGEAIEEAFFADPRTPPAWKRLGNLLLERLHTRLRDLKRSADAIGRGDQGAAVTAASYERVKSLHDADRRELVDWRRLVGMHALLRLLSSDLPEEQKRRRASEALADKPNAYANTIVDALFALSVEDRRRLANAEDLGQLARRIANANAPDGARRDTQAILSSYETLLYELRRKIPPAASFGMSIRDMIDFGAQKRIPALEKAIASFDLESAARAEAAAYHLPEPDENDRAALRALEAALNEHSSAWPRWMAALRVIGTRCGLSDDFEQLAKDNQSANWGWRLG